jgi:hypothetical protein
VTGTVYTVEDMYEALRAVDYDPTALILEGDLISPAPRIIWAG